MAIEDVGAILQPIRAEICSTFEHQSNILHQARIAHSHSDDLLPPDLAQDVLLESTKNLQSKIQSVIEAQPENSRTTFQDIIRRELLAVECRRFVFAILSEAQQSQEQDVQEKIRKLFDRFDIDGQI